MVVKKRLLYVDAFRGLAIILMVFLNIFDYSSIYDVHVDEPFYVPIIDGVTFLPPILLFSFVSGMSALLLTESAKKKTATFTQFMRRVVLKYGKYFLLSIPFTLFMWGFKVLYGFEEAIQGLSISSIITCLILYKLKDRKKMLILALIIYLAQSVLLYSFRVYGLPFSEGFGIAGILLNLLFGGWFSIMNLVPFMLVGSVFLENFKENKVNTNLIISLVSALAIIIFWTVSPVDYYMRSFTLLFYVTAFCGAITLIIYYLIRIGFRLDVIRTFGLISFEAYIIHFLIAKLIRLVGFGDSLPFLPACFVSFSVLLLFYIIGSFYIKTVKKQVL